MKPGKAVVGLLDEVRMAMNGADWGTMGEVNSTTAAVLVLAMEVKKLREVIQQEAKTVRAVSAPKTGGEKGNDNA